MPSTDVACVDGGAGDTAVDGVGIGDCAAHPANSAPIAAATTLAFAVRSARSNAVRNSRSTGTAHTRPSENAPACMRKPIRPSTTANPPHRDYTACRDMDEAAMNRLNAASPVTVNTAWLKQFGSHANA